MKCLFDMITDAYALIMHMIKFLIVFNIRDVIDAVLEYDPNSNVSLAVTPEGPVVRVMFISGFVFVFHYSQSIL
jgi:hypothetical protein